MASSIARGRVRTTTTTTESRNMAAILQVIGCQRHTALGPLHTYPFSGYGYRPHYNAENDHRERSHSKTLSRVERFENDAFWKRCFLVWTVKTMLSENGDVIQIDTTGRQPTRPLVSKMADRRSHVASLLIGTISSLLTLLQAHLTNNNKESRMAPISWADILKCACVEFIWVCALRV